MKTILKYSLILAIALSLISSVNGASANEKKLVPTTVFNGSNWRKLERINEEWAHMFKVCLVRGIYEGSFALDPENAYEQYGPWVSFKDLVSALDRFYAEDRNLQIPVSYALVLIAKNPSGSTLKPIEPPSSGSGNAQRRLVSL